MKYTSTKIMVCALAAAVSLSVSPMEAKAAGVSSSLPAAGLGLALGDGTSLSELLDERDREQTETAETEEETKETQTGTQETEDQETLTEETDAQTQEAETGRGLAEGTMIIAQVTDYVNIRSTAGTDGEIVGKLYNNSVGYLIREEGEWFQIKSGTVEGYVKAEYFETGEKAEQIAREVGDTIAIVDTETLRVRTEPSLDASVLGLVPGGEDLSVLDEENGFVKVSIEEGDGWVSTDYVKLETEYVTAESIEEEQERIRRDEEARAEAKRAAQAAEEKLHQQEEEKKKQEQEQQAKEDAAEPAQEPQEAATPVSSSGSGLGQAVVNYALQFVGNPYVYGGTSLTNGADCSGFVMSVYQNFGVSLPHSSSADRSVGYGVGSLAEAQPGDLLCYSGHVAIYMGNGQIVHASTASTGIKVSEANYRKILAIRRIF